MAKVTKQQVARMVAGHPDGSLPRMFEAALAGATTRNESPREAVRFALGCVAELMDIEANGCGDE